MWEKFTDRQLADMIRSGEVRAESRAIRFLVRNNREKAIRWVCANAGGREDGEDAFNDALSALCINIRSGSYRLSENVALGTYLMTIVKYTWLKQLRRQGRFPGMKSIADDGTESIEVVRSAEQIMMEQEKDDRFRQIFERSLTDREKGILMASLVEKIPMKEIAERFELGNADNAKSHKYQIIKKLKKVLGDDKFWA
ncbi:hypothetical protein GCM10023091_25270 [Ravibacter arvi]|uniref:RNA polymerase sigma-70 region 2 domain-containing protein n=1 Tax=Ravibacter arvi TaxID=2051041 RepID=A0ABP8LZD1_9BACT